MNYKSLNRNAPQRPQPIRPPQRPVYQPPRPTSGLALPPITPQSLAQASHPAVPSSSSLSLPTLALPPHPALAAAAPSPIPAEQPQPQAQQPPTTQPAQNQLVPGQELSLEQQYITNVEGIVPTLQ
jgi:hypothetical protein